MGYVFLGQVIVLSLLVIWLFIETQCRGFEYAGHSTRKQMGLYAVVSTCFALSYIGRFLLNEYF